MHYNTAQLSMAWVDLWVGLGRVHYSKSTKQIERIMLTHYNTAELSIWVGVTHGLGWVGSGPL